MFLLALALGVAVGWLRRGSLLNLGQLPLRFLWGIAVAFALRLLVSRGGVWPGWPAVSDAAPWLLAGSYMLLLVVVLANRRLPGMGLLAAGAALNLVVMAANGGRMPVSPDALTALGAQAVVEDLARGADPVHALLTSDTRLPFLADVFHLPQPFPLRELFSVGDVLIALALAHLVQAGMRGPRAGRETA